MNLILLIKDAIFHVQMQVYALFLNKNMQNIGPYKIFCKECFKKLKILDKKCLVNKC